MKDLQEAEQWTTTQLMLTNHFKDSTVEFLWEKQTKITETLLNSCILLNCILLNFRILSNVISFPIANRTKHRPKKAKQTQLDTWAVPAIRLENKVHTILQNLNSDIVAVQRFTSHKFLLVSDSTFPETNSSYPFSKRL